MGVFSLFIIIYAFVGLSISLFGSISYLLFKNGLINSICATTGQEISANTFFDFYLWNILNGIPALEINTTIGWDAPLEYKSWQLGWLIVLFKLAVIIPSIGAFVAYWDRNKGDGKGAE
jgi:glucan phosphoethanolaminetransferase (alkaline phosphatase superfamily)